MGILQNDSDVENFQKVVNAIKNSKNVSCSGIIHTLSTHVWWCLGPQGWCFH